MSRWSALLGLGALLACGAEGEGGSTPSAPGLVDIGLDVGGADVVEEANDANDAPEPGVDAGGGGEVAASGGDGLIRLTFVGDVAFTWRPAPAGAEVSEAEDPFRFVRPWLQEADLTLANMEGVLVEEDPRFAKPDLNLWAPPVWAPTLGRAGIDVVSHANNHAFDGRAEGIFRTRAAIEATGVHVVGSGRTVEEARRPYIHRVERGCVAILPATLGVNRKPAEDDAHLALYIFEASDDLFEEVRRARAACEAVAVYVHWGPEYREVPIPFVRRYARRLVEAGAQLVVGHHPHVLQGVEHRPGGVIVFSLGNFVFWRPPPAARLSGVLDVSLRLGEDGAAVEDLRLRPVVIGGDDHAPMPAEGPQLDAVLARMQQTSRRLGTRVRLDDDGIRFEPMR